MISEPAKLPTRDVESTTPGIRFLTWITLIVGLIAGVVLAWWGWKAENWNLFGWGLGIGTQTLLVCLVLFAFTLTAENIMAIARSQEIQIAKLEAIRRGVTASQEIRERNS